MACRLVALAFAVSVAAGLLRPAVAFAFTEPNGFQTNSCVYCHSSWAGMICDDCHGEIDDGVGADNGYEQGKFSGPHAGYTSTTDKCDNCHQVHQSTGSLKLLPTDTIVATCFSCHDGTGGFGVYGTVLQRTGNPAPGGHSYSAANLIPGGAADGGDATRVFKGPGGLLICTDCHSPHGAEVVDAFAGDRRRLRIKSPNVTSTRLLRRQPTGATTAVTKYGSDWCLTCHAGRDSGGAVHNHPVESVANNSPPYDYANLPVLDSNGVTGVTVLGNLGGVQPQPDGFPEVTDAHDWPDSEPPGYNRGYLMPYPRTAQQAGHFPICQQCHEDARSVGQLVGDGSTADALEAYVEAGDGVYWNGSAWVSTLAFDNPAIQNFPHETLNTKLLVETGDNLCTNCHPASRLP